MSMPPVGFEPTILAGERPQNYDLERAAAETSIQGKRPHLVENICAFIKSVAKWMSS